MEWLVAAAVVLGLFWWDRAANAAAARVLAGPTPPPPAPGPSRTARNVAPFVSGAPPATYNLDPTQLGQSISMRVGDTLTITAPLAVPTAQPGTRWYGWSAYGWTPSIVDTESGSDQSQSAVYPFGSMSPGLASEALATTETQTFGYVAIKPGLTSLYLLPVTGPQPSGAPVLAANVTVTP